MGEVLTDLRDGVLTVTLHRPSRLNALSVSLQRELAGLWARVRGDAGIRCIVVTGAGRAFCAGADAADLDAMTAPQSRDRGRIEFCPAAWVDVPVLVAVNGLCLGAGLRLLADADMAIASDLAWFSDPHVSVGQLGTPVALALAEKCSAAAVARLFLSGSSFRMPAAQALSAGLVSEVVAADELDPRATEIAVSVAAQSPAAARATVAALRRRHREALGTQVAQAWADVARQRAHPDAAEGARALAEGRPARWSPWSPASRIRRGGRAVSPLPQGLSFGLGMISAQHVPRDRRTDTEIYAGILDLCVAAEDLGLDAVWLSEHHFVDDGYMPSLLPAAAAIAARTARIAVGTGVLIAPFYDPLRLVEDAATVDLIAAGRLVLGLGAGYRDEEFNGFGRTQDGLGAVLDQAIEILRAGWSDGTVPGRAPGVAPVTITPSLIERAARRSGLAPAAARASAVPPARPTGCSRRG